jgi:hypothetical protein
MRIVAGKAITCCLIMNVAASRTTFFLAVALQTELGGRSREQLDAGYVLADAHFMTAEAIFLSG